MNPDDLGPLFAVKRVSPETSHQAAEHILVRAAGLREASLRLIRASVDGLTADEVAHALGESVLAVRPRITQLHRPPDSCKGWVQMIRDSGFRRPNVSGVNAVVWVPLSEEEIAVKRIEKARRLAKSDAAA